MAGVARTFLRRVRVALRGLAWPACLGLLLPAAGCVTATAYLPAGWLEQPPEQVCKVVGFWDRKVHVARDSLNRGAELPCLAGRVYFFGADESHTFAARGQVLVDWYDISGPDGTQPRPLGRVVYDPDSLQQFKKKDFLGVGYTIILDWPSYTPNVNRVRVHLCFIPEKGAPIYADPADVTLQTEQVQISRQQQTIPAVDYQPAVKK
jgi:hypothetical protein